jgi:hypothetical protein
VRRFAMLMLSLSLTLSVTGAQLLFAQDAKKAETKPADAPAAKPDAAKPADAPAPKADAAKPAETKPAETPKDEAPKPVPPEVQKKIDAAWKAIAEAVVAAEDAGLVQTSIKPPPILDILITGRATDETALKSRQGVSPEVFGAWFTGFGKSEMNLSPENDVKIVPPSLGLKTWYDQRSTLLTREMDAIRKTKPAPAAEAKKEEPKKAEPKKEEIKKEETKKEEVKKEETKK